MSFSLSHYTTEVLTETDYIVFKSVMLSLGLGLGLKTEFFGLGLGLES